MKFIRRVVSAVVLGAIFAAGIRVRGSGGTPPQSGGWRPLDVSDTP
jgi:hypothetical protein